MKHEKLEIDGYVIIVIYHDKDSELLLEAKMKGEALIGSYSYIKNKPHTPDGDYHLHVYDGNNEIFAINKGGSSHDGYHGVRIPNKVYQALTKKFDKWIFPPSQIIETINYCYILKPKGNLSYKEILNEYEIIQEERNILGTFHRIIETKQVINEQVTLSDLDSQEAQLSTRFKDLFIELVTR